jgi:hypothetical protein
MRQYKVDPGFQINEKVERKIGDLTELYATETILARLIDPAMISRAELQVISIY